MTLTQFVSIIDFLTAKEDGETSPTFDTKDPLNKALGKTKFCISFTVLYWARGDTCMYFISCIGGEGGVDGNLYNVSFIALGMVKNKLHTD